jgi:uncharacterized C2H2 Zn-finger protein
MEHEWPDTQPDSRCERCGLRYKDWSDYNYHCPQS